MSAYITGPIQSVSGGTLSAVDATADTSKLGKRVYGLDATGNSAEFIYLKGATSTIVGSVVTFDEAGATALIAANAKGPVAVSMGITDSSTKGGWYGIQGTFPTDVVASCADNANLGRETTDGKVGDGFASGDLIANFYSRNSTTGAAVINCQIDHGFVNDTMG